MLKKNILALIISSSLLGCGGGSNDTNSQTTIDPKPPTENLGGDKDDNKKPVIKPEVDDNKKPVVKPDIDQDKVDTAPTVAQVPMLTVVADNEKSYQVAAKSNTDRKLIFSLENNPSWVSINEETGLITLAPNFADTGNLTFTLIVSDSKLKTSLKVSVSVVKHNLAPTFTTTEDSFKTKVNNEFTLNLKATDPNNDVITFSSDNLPTWLNLDALTGKVTGTPTSSESGLYSFDIIVSDGELETTKKFNLNVYEEKELKLTTLLEDKKIELSGISEHLTHPKAIAVDDNYIYLANDIKGGSFFIINKNSGEVVKEISSFVKNGNTYTYQLVSDLYVNNGKLYVASLSSNRVDIFDTKTFELITSLGVGSWAGDDRFTLVHPQGVAANDKYVFVLDNKSEVAVYQQSDIEKGQFLNIKKHAYLYLGGSGIWRKQQMVIKGDRLLINDTIDNLFAAYDITEIEASLERSEAIQPVSLTSTVTMLAADNKDFLTVKDNTAHISKSVSYTQNSIAFEDTYLSTKADNNGNKFTGLIDSEINNSKIYNLKNDSIIIDTLGSVTGVIETNTSVKDNPPIKLDTLPSENVTKQLQDGTSWEDLTNPDKFNFKLDQLINIKFDKQHNIIVTSYAAQETKNIDINIKMKGSDTWFKAFNIDKLPAYGHVVIPNDQIQLEQLNSTEGSKVLDLSSFINDERYDLNVLLDNEYQSTTDPLVQKLKKIKVKWTLNFGSYSPADGEWFKITPLYAREWVIMATNFAYLLSSPEFEYTWFNFKDIFGKDFYGNDGPQESVNGFFTPDEYQKYYDEMMNRNWIRIGLTNKGGGLGGGDVWGVDTWIFYSHYYARIPGASLGAVGHEFGHHWGSHDSAWAQEWFGLQQISHYLNQYFLRNVEFPYTDDNINGFYKASNEERYGKGVEPSYRVPSTTLNPLEIYLQNHFDKPTR
ncbi:hypothetical protein C0W80_10855 [Photobacterium leiognathi subsp. mandapamensis]|uniref:putative Ig domain-containing protein n=1 Tax=Photobacterium leiognathi TaxID=553611 RepID=UPI000D158300|nr:putative Ig domain-containing protein [Photobacterium leiognathi]PSV01381.1 hypothetical protein C0W80_10855 [Photobacterium leiognathi subsp. mandapamensis]